MREKALSRLGRGRPNAQIRPVENAQRLKRWGEITRANRDFASIVEPCQLMQR